MNLLLPDIAISILLKPPFRTAVLLFKYDAKGQRSVWIEVDEWASVGFGAFQKEVEHHWKKKWCMPPKRGRKLRALCSN